MAAKCRECGRPLRDSKFELCYDCNQKRRQKQSRLPDNYLNKGFLDEDGYIYPDLLDETAKTVAQAFEKDNPTLTNSQLRRFYSHAVAAEDRLNLTGEFKAGYTALQKLKSYAAEAQSKGKVPRAFYDFINANINSIHDEKTFRQGFMEHFEAVVAYYYFLFPRN